MNNLNVTVSILTAILFAFLPLSAFPSDLTVEPDGSDANIIGHVTDRKTGEHLPAINVMLKGTMIYTATDATGHYFLKNLPEGRYVLEVSSLGYKTQTRDVTLKRGVTLELNFEIEEDMSMLDGIVVSANRSTTTRKTAPTIVNVLTPVQFENINASTVSSVLTFQPG